MCNYKRVVLVRTNEKHMVTIRVEQSLIGSAMYEHIFLENIKKLYKYSGKCDYQQHHNAIIEAAMVSSTEGINDNIPM